MLYISIKKYCFFALIIIPCKIYTNSFLVNTRPILLVTAKAPLNFLAEYKLNDNIGIVGETIIYQNFQDSLYGLHLRYHYSANNFRGWFTGMYLAYEKKRTSFGYFENPQGKAIADAESTTNPSKQKGYAKVQIYKLGLNVGYIWVVYPHINITLRVGSSINKSNTHYYDKNGTELNFKPITEQLTSQINELAHLIDTELSIGYFF